jgi:hypothetical protein
MTTAVQNAPGTATDLLFGPGASATEALAHQIMSAHADRELHRLPRQTREAAILEAAAAAAGLLDGDLTGMIVAGWRTHHDLVGAARRTLAAPTTTELVDLVDHQVTTTQQPSVAVLVDGRQVATIQVSLSVEFDIGALVAGVQAGRLVAIHAGHCEVTATLGIQGTTVLTKKAHFGLPGVISVKPGIRLLPAEEYLADDGANAPTLPMRTPQAPGALPQQPGKAAAGSAAPGPAAAASAHAGSAPSPRWWS